jgi:hypothetical protein
VFINELQNRLLFSPLFPSALITELLMRMYQGPINRSPTWNPDQNFPLLWNDQKYKLQPGYLYPIISLLCKSIFLINLINILLQKLRAICHYSIWISDGSIFALFVCWWVCIIVIFTHFFRNENAYLLFMIARLNVFSMYYNDHYSATILKSVYGLINVFDLIISRSY